MTGLREGSVAPAHGAAWFCRVGTPLTSRDVAAIADLLRVVHESSRVEVRGLAHWHEVGAVLRAADWGSAAWEREEDERQRLWQSACERIDEDELVRQLVATTDSMAGALRDAAVSAAVRDGGADPGLVGAAVEAASMAAHQSALAWLAGEGAGHFFVRRHELFESGRWPLGVHRGEYLVF